MDIGSIKDNGVWVIVAGLCFEFPALHSETPEDAHKRVVASMDELMRRPPGQRLFVHEKPRAEVLKLGKVLPGRPEYAPETLPVVSFLHVPDGVQVQVLPGTAFKAFMREQQIMASRAQGMAPPPGLIRG